MKQVHWQLPFGSLDGNQYRIDIYAEGAPTEVKTLVGAAEPFTTDEDNSDDFFSPVRGSTGSLSVVDEDGMLMESILPNSNIDRPIRVVNVLTGDIEWQGFLSCNAYTQSYTSRPQVLTLNVNSVLEAMNSIHMNVSSEIQFNTLAAYMFYAMRSIEERANVGELFDNIYISENYLSMLTGTYIFNNVFFKNKEVVNGGTTEYIYYGDTLSNVIKTISSFCGCVVREGSRDIYMDECSNGSKYYKITWEQAKQIISSPSSMAFPIVSMEDKRMSDLTWMGDGHTKTVLSGASRVIVTSNVDKYGNISSLPSIPFGNLIEYSPMLINNRTYSAINTNEQFDTRVTCYAYGARYQMTKIIQQAGVWIWGDVTFSVSGQLPTIPYNDSVLSKGSSLPIIQKYSSANDTSSQTGIDQTLFIGSYFAKVEVYSGEEKQYHDTKDCLVISGCCTDDGQRRTYAPNTNPLFVMRSTNTFSAIGGWLNINATVDFIRGNGYYGVDFDAEVKMSFGLKFGDRFWNGSQWVSGSPTSIPRFPVTIKDGTVKTNKTDDMKTEDKDGWFVPLPFELITGEVSLYIFYEMSGSSAWYALISSLTVDYSAQKDNKMNANSSNEYNKELGGDFDEEKTISLNISSNAENENSPSIIKNVIGEQVGRTIIGDSYEHPEEHLIGLMNDYYCKPRRIISLETEGMGKRLSFIRLKGYDGRTYRPLSESKNWKTGVSTIRCFEVEE